MIEFPAESLSQEEKARLRALTSYRILEFEKHEFIDRITRIAALALQQPIAAITLVDKESVWIKSSFGLDLQRIPRETSFCARAIKARSLYEVCDAATDENSRQNSLVTGVLGVRFYAGVPLIDPDGYAIGTLCVLNTRPQKLSEQGRVLLSELAAVTMDEILLWQRTNQLRTEIRTRKELETTASRQEKVNTLGVMVGGVAHDLNNLLSPIVTNAQRLELESGDAAQREMAANIVKAGQRGAQLCSTLLAFEAEQNTELRCCNLREIVDNAISEFRQTRTGHPLILNLEETNPYIEADDTQITQVLINLLANAADASASHEPIELTISPELLSTQKLEQMTFSHSAMPGSYFKVTVQDRGTGISDISRILEPFYSTKQEGTGLGVPFAIGLLKNHRAPVLIRSVPNQGTEFSFWLHYGQQDEEHASQPAHHATLDKRLMSSQNFAFRLLVVEDDPDVRAALVGLLEYCGCDVESTGNGMAAVEQLAERPFHFDAAIVDLSMPELDGLEVSRKLLAVRHDFPILLTTGNPSDPRIETCLEMGVKLCLRKPFSIQTIQQALKEISQIH